MSAARLLALALLAALAAGCAGHPMGRHAAGGPPRPCLPPGRSLVLARVSNADNRATAEGAASMLANALRPSAHTLNAPDFVSEAGTVGLGLWASTLTTRVERGARLSEDDSRTLREQFGINALVSTDVTEYDQVWGRNTKYTRVGLEVQAVDLGADQVLWRHGGRSEVQDMPGRAFRTAMDRAVAGVATSICPPPPPTLRQTLQQLTGLPWHE